MELRHLRSFVFVAETVTLNDSAYILKNKKLKDYEQQRKIIPPDSGDRGEVHQLHAEGR